jgi:acyl-coenzyme A thioesterase PaaI-like protein
MMSTDVRPGSVSFAAALGRFGGAEPDYEGIRRVANNLAPFNNLVGLQVVEIGPDRAVVEIPVRENLGNHLGTVHAAVLFLAADIAGAAALVGALAPRLDEIEHTVLRDGRSSFRRPAAGPIRAVGTADRELVQRLLDGREPRYDLDAKVALYDERDVLVAKFTFDYVCSLIAR